MQRKAFMGELLLATVAISIVMAAGLSVATTYAPYGPSPYKPAYWVVFSAWGMAVSISIYVIDVLSQRPAAISMPIFKRMNPPLGA